jgi:hypothetical protein
LYGIIGTVRPQCADHCPSDLVKVGDAVAAWKRDMRVNMVTWMSAHPRRPPYTNGGWYAVSSMIFSRLYPGPLGNFV